MGVEAEAVPPPPGNVQFTLSAFFIRNYKVKAMTYCVHMFRSFLKRIFNIL